MRLESGEKDAVPCLAVEDFFSYIHVELSFENVEELVLTRMHMRRRLSSRYQSCLKEGECSLVSCVSVRSVSNLPMYHLDNSKDGALLNAFKGNDVFFILFSFRGA